MDIDRDNALAAAKQIQDDVLTALWKLPSGDHMNFDSQILQNSTKGLCQKLPNWLGKNPWQNGHGDFLDKSCKCSFTEMNFGQVAPQMTIWMTFCIKNFIILCVR